MKCRGNHSSFLWPDIFIYKVGVLSQCKWHIWCHQDWNQGHRCTNWKLWWNTLPRGRAPPPPPSPRSSLAPLARLAFGSSFARRSYMCWQPPCEISVQWHPYSAEGLHFSLWVSIPPASGENVELDHHYNWTREKWCHEEAKDTDTQVTTFWS